MPTYTYECQNCGFRIDDFRPMKLRNELNFFCCKKLMKRIPELFVASTFVPYFDEGLGCDVYSLSDKKRILKEEGLIEAGDRVGGAINFDSKAPHILGKEPLKGKRKKKVVAKDFPIEIVDARGKTIDRTTFQKAEGYGTL